MLPFLFLLQTAAPAHDRAAAPPRADTVASRASALRRLVARATEANGEVPRGLAGYDAALETEVGFVLERPAPLPGAVAGSASPMVEEAGQVEQFAARLRWERDGAQRLHVVGYRMLSSGATLSALTFATPRASTTTPGATPSR